jgi:hypothetical protein
MPKKIRDLILILFVFIFIVMATVTCLFASGYKFNLSWPLQFNRLLQKTGILNISSSPKGAFIYLNGKEQKKPTFNLFKKNLLTTPVKIKNLLPGNYNLKLEKESYWPIEKKITIESGLTTFEENINLFRSDLPTIVYKSKEDTPLLSSSGNYLYLSLSQELIDLKYLSPNLLTEKPESGGIWLKDDYKLFSNGKIFNLSNNTILDLTDILGKDIKSWKYNKKEDFIYYASRTNTINRLEGDGKTTTTLLKTANYLDYKIEDNSIFTISQVENKKYLQEYNISDQQELKKMELPSIGDYFFSPSNKNNYLALYDKKNSSLYLINKENWQKSITINRIKDWDWIDKNRIIYHNGWEIILFNINDDVSSLLKRVSEPINEIIWHDKENYFIFSTDKNLQAGDLQASPLTTLFKTEKIGEMTLDIKKNILYFYTEIGQQKGIYKLLLK